MTNKKKQWNKYCGFLDLSLDNYMEIQKNCLNKQLDVWLKSNLAKEIINDSNVNASNFRSKINLTTYSDYAEILLNKNDDDLPSKPKIWIQTTWEGGTKPIKLAPYSQEMLETFQNNILASLMLATSSKKGKYSFKMNDKMLYGLAPLPYLTGLLPKLLSNITNIKFLPSSDKASEMSFSQRNKEGFKQAIHSDVEIFFGLGSVVNAVSKSLSLLNQKSKDKHKHESIFKFKPHMLKRLAVAKLKCKFNHRGILPKDLFHLKALVVAGTDNCYYKDDLEKMWGVRPIEIFAGTEPSLIGMETWSKDGLYFFPNACYYEFIKLEDTIKNKLEKNYVPKTYLMNEVEVNQKYELVISSFDGGAFVRYRCGDIYECLALGSDDGSIRIPRFKYLDRIPWIIDIAGFTRFTEEEITNVFKLSQIRVNDWMAIKDTNADNKPIVRLFLELEQEMDKAILLDKLEQAFLKIDEDYVGVKKILGTNPLELEILAKGTINNYKSINPSFLRVNSMDNDILKFIKQ